jgi:hypothetical protein
MSSSNSKVKTTPPALDAVSASSSALPQFEPCESPAGGWGALQATAKAPREQSAIFKGSNPLLAMKPGGQINPRFGQAAMMNA